MVKTVVKQVMTAIFLLLIMPYSSSLPETFPFEEINFDVFYPQSSFSKVEHSCKELWSDLDLFIKGKLGVNVLTREYLSNQFLRLKSAIHTLIYNSEPESCYLTEDIEYLLAVFVCLEKRYQQFCELYATKESSQWKIILEESKENLHLLFTMTPEVYEE